MIPIQTSLPLLLLLTAANIPPQPGSIPFNASLTVVIDAGHGGKDPGGMGANSQEKHIVLSVAQLLEQGIRNNYPEVTVILTRDDDTFVPLHERAAIANEAGADLFISIHANIMPGRSTTYGTETYVMGQHVAEHNLRVAKRENAAILLEEDFKKNYDYDPNSDEGHILLSMFQHAYLERSIQLAEAVEQQFAAKGRKKRGVKQAGFVVLKETTMPSVLVEIGFMSNPEEEAFLLSGTGQREIAESILRAFGEYYRQTTDSAVAAPKASVAQTARPAMADPLTSKGGTIARFPGTYALPTARATSYRPPVIPSDSIRPQPDYRFQEAPTAVARPATAATIDLTQIPDAELLYAVQIIATKNSPDLSTSPYNRLPYPIQRVSEDGWNKYEIRGLRSANEARVARERAKVAGFEGPMIIVRLNGKKLGRKQVKYLLNR